MPPVVLETQHALTDFVGREIALTEWLTITQDRIDRFAEATQDRQWIHVDRERAQRESPYGTTIAHGFLTLSLLSFLMKQVIQFRGGVRMGINWITSFHSPDGNVRRLMGFSSVEVAL